MHVAIFTPADNLTGGCYRTFRILEEYPRGKYTLMMPGDAIERLRRDFGGVAHYTRFALAKDPEAHPRGADGLWRR